MVQLLVMSIKYISQSGATRVILVTAAELQEDWLGTKDEIGSSNIRLYNSNLHLDLVPQEISWSWHQNCKRMGWVQILSA